jgi:hypothetical protein
MARGDRAVLEIGEGPDDFEGLMALIVTGLEQRGVEGSPDVIEPDEVPDFPKHGMVVAIAARRCDRRSPRRVQETFLCAA